ncbi:glycosyltransferase family 2 protein [Nocardia sp. NPDC055029]
MGTRIQTPAGEPYPNGRRFPSTTLAARHAIMSVLRPGSNSASAEYFGPAIGRPDADQIVDWVSGCSLMMKRPLWEQMRGFDPRYWMYLEDADLAWRLRENGYTTVLSGPAWVTHHGGQSGKFRRNRSLWHHHRSAALFYVRTRPHRLAAHPRPCRLRVPRYPSRCACRTQLRPPPHHPRLTLGVDHGIRILLAAHRHLAHPLPDTGREPPQRHHVPSAAGDSQTGLCNRHGQLGRADQPSLFLPSHRFSAA